MLLALKSLLTVTPQRKGAGEESSPRGQEGLLTRAESQVSRRVDRTLLWVLPDSFGPCPPHGASSSPPHRHSCLQPKAGPAQEGKAGLGLDFSAAPHPRLAGPDFDI